MRERLRSREKAAYRLMNAALLTWMALFGTAEFLGTGGRLHLLTALVVLAVLMALNFLEARGRLLCLGIFLGLLWAGIMVIGWEESKAFLGSFLPWLLGEGDSRMLSGGALDATGRADALLGTMPKEWIFGYGMLRAALTAAVCYGMQLLFEKLPMLKRIFAALVVVGMLAAMGLRWEVDHISVVFLGTYVMLVYGEWVQGRWEKVRGGGNTREAHTLWIMPFLVLYLLLMAAMPAPEEPYDWMWAKKLYSQVEDAVMTFTRNLKWGSREGFGMAFTGFSEEGELGGNLQQDAGEIMTIQVQPGGGQYRPENLYLAGSISDTFDGRGWSRERQGAFGEAFLDTLQTLYLARRTNGEYERDYLREICLDIRYEDFNTSHIFVPLKTWRLEQWDERTLDYVSEGEEFRWEGQKGYGTEYRLRYYEMNLGQAQFDWALEQALDEPEETKEEIWAEALQECSRKINYNFTVDEVQAYRQAVLRDYLGEIELSAEVRSWLQKATEGAQTQVEKLRAIERGLAGLSYTRTPGDLPKWVRGEREFLDYFLLESRQGYCTYFATAFVLLARAEGIPARYVQGYCVPVEEGTTLVYSNMAHAWPEVYLEGAGWIPFEPTPGYGEQRYHSWELAQPKDGVLREEIILPPEPEAVSNGNMGNAGADPEAQEKWKEAEREQRAQRISWKLAGLGGLAILLACGGLWIIDGIRHRRRYQKLEPEEKLRTEVFQNLELLRWLGLERKPWETLQETGERARGLPGLETDERPRFLEDYERVVYGAKRVEADMIQEAVREREKILKLLKAQKKWAYFYCCVKMHLLSVHGSRARQK